MGRKILAIVIGLFVGGVVNMLLVSVSSAVYPLPEGVSTSDFDSFKAHVEENGLETGALVIVIAAHSGGSLVSGLVCGLIVGRAWYIAALGMGLFWTAGGITMLFMLPSPIWFAIADTVLYVPAALLGVQIGGSLTGRGAPAGAEPKTADVGTDD